LVLTNANLDLVRVGGVASAQTFSYGLGTVAGSATDGDIAGVIVNAVETGATQVTYTFATDSVGTADLVLTIQGFDAGAAGDVLDLSGADAVTATFVATTGAVVGDKAAVGDANQMIVGGTAAAQIVGALTATTDAGAVEAAILALGLRTAAATVTNFYVTLDNGTDTGVYRVRATAGDDTAINNANEFTVTLISVLQGIADVNSFTAFNFA
jgi:hypothetical protein